MRHKLVVLLALLAHVLFASSAAATSTESQEVWLLEPVDYPQRWLEAEHRLVAELETAGFRVVRRQVTATDEEALLRGLVNSEPVFASFIMLREGAGGAAFVWLAGAARIKRFAMSDVSSSRAAGAIALRVTEYLNMQVLTIAVPVPEATPEAETAAPTPPELPAEAEPAPAPRTARTQPPRNGLLWLGPSATLSSDSENVALGASLGVAVRLFGPLLLEGNAEIMPLPLVVETSFGNTKISGSGARLVALFETALAEKLSLGLGLGLGLLRLNSESDAQPGVLGESDSTTTGLLAARVRLAFSTLTGFTVLASLDPGLSLPSIRVQADGHDVARLGRPWFLATLGAGWSF